MTCLSQSIIRSKCSYLHLFKRSYSIMNGHLQEVKIPVPWGHVAGKWWGPTHKRPILSIHGWQDNCASFDRLIPLLDKNTSFLCIDLPGHGLSSRIPPGMNYQFMVYCIAIQSIIQHYKWPKVSFMGHSMGGLTCYAFSSLFPEKVDFGIFIDGFIPFPNRGGADFWRKYYQKFFKYQELENSSNEPPAYTMEEIREKVSAALENSINYEHSLIMAERNISPSKTHPGKYIFTRDPRLKAGVSFEFTEKAISELSQSMCFPMLMIKAKQSKYFGLKDTMENIIEEFKKNEVDMEFHFVEGNHHVHLNQPEVLSDLIDQFLSRMQSQQKKTGLIAHL